MPSGAGAAGLPSAAFATAMMLVFSLIYLALAGWSVGTLVGLVRMRPWARISTIVIASGLAALSLLSAVSMLFMQSIFSSGSVPMPPNVPPAFFHKVLIFLAVASLVVAVLSIGWIVYLAQRRVRAVFEQARAHQLAAQRPHGYPPAQLWPAAYGSGQPSPPTTPHPPLRARQPAPNPLTDFTFARPLATHEAQSAPSPDQPSSAPAPDPDAALVWQAQAAPQPGAWPALAAEAPRTGRPVSVTIISVFALISAFFSLIGVISPSPASLFGVVVSGLPLHLYSVVWAAGLAIAGLGMLRLQRPAWVLAFVLLGTNSINAVIQLLPGPRARNLALMNSQLSMFGTQQTALTSSVMAMSMIFSMVLALLFSAFFAFILWRTRWAFPAAPPQPPADAPQAD